MTKPRDPNCCLCGLPYERIGNNPAPLSLKKGDRCCDACNEVVTGARIDPVGVAAEIRRIMEAIARMNPKGVVTNRTAIAAMCAARGPGLLAEKKAQLAKLHALIEAEKAKL
jgi:hypothetical protein